MFEWRETKMRLECVSVWPGIACRAALTRVLFPQVAHSVPLQHNPGQFGEALLNIVVTKRTNLEERHAVLLCVILGRVRVHLSLEGQMQSIADQNLRYAGCMLFNLLQPSIQTGERPLIGNVVDQEDALRTTRVGPNDRSESALP